MLTFSNVLDHPYFVGLQAHPEFCTRPLNPSPPFLGFIAAASSSTVFAEQLAAQKHYASPHPEAARIIPDHSDDVTPVEVNGTAAPGLVNGHAAVKPAAARVVT